MSKFRKKPVVIEAHQWFRNGDHPDDDSDGSREGKLVRFFRTPSLNGNETCSRCGAIYHEHGWIDTLEGRHEVCPGDWIIKGVQGEFYPCKPGIFEETYDPVDSDGDSEPEE